MQSQEGTKTSFAPAERNCGKKTSSEGSRFKVDEAFFALNTCDSNCQICDKGKNGQQLIILGIMTQNNHIYGNNVDLW
ncbi:hypothetical protein CCR75_006035 [Bremia lactucae]|uniref:Uncharacterized protein n=1 Tax=Bremia lactucae TaxID=4779 RepID=A0A976FM61_BRELC|nr:hypothetical protein CCR75_006035 [Bremia lactucae]